MPEPRDRVRLRARYVSLRSDRARMVRFMLGHRHRQIPMPRLMIRSTSWPRFRLMLVWPGRVRR